MKVTCTIGEASRWRAKSGGDRHDKQMNLRIRCSFLAPFTSAHQLMTLFMITSGMQGQLVCSGCRSVLLYPRGAASVCCAICSTITTVPPPGASSTSFLLVI
ncbi:hypothetical protein BHE74_00022657 [Ensete ventricosum]|nr:hypothetical protein BHE74_00022657 [Ensete ventricosum]